VHSIDPDVKDVASQCTIHLGPRNMVAHSPHEFTETSDMYIFNLSLSVWHVDDVKRLVNLSNIS
jgi:hypothetical protein